MPKPKPKRIAQPGVRHRRDNGPAALEIIEAPAPTPDQLGQVTKWTQDIIEGGPDALIAATHKAAKMSAKFGIEFEQQWLLVTPWLTRLRGSDLGQANPSRHRAYLAQKARSANPDASQKSGNVEADQRGQAQVRYAMQWRPKWLAVLALTNSRIIASRAAEISHQTLLDHERRDPDFAAQIAAAHEYAIQLLHDVAYRRAIEGDLEPIFWQGIKVGHVKKWDGRLQIEMLRAHMPKKFKTPGDKGPIVAGDGNQILVCDAETIKSIQEAHRASLLAMNPQPGAVTDLNISPNGERSDPPKPPIGGESQE